MLRAMRGIRAITTLALVAGGPIAIALSTGSASAEGPSTARLSWVRAQGAETCVDAPVLARDVNKRLGRDAFGGTPSRSIEGIVAREGTKWVAKLYVRDLAGALVGDRELTSDAADCAALSGAVTLAIALVIDPEAALAPPPSSSASSSSPPLPSATPSASIAPATVVPIAPVRVRPVIVEARFGLSTGLVPRVAPAVLVGAEGTTTFHPRVLALFVPSTRIEDGTVGFGLTAASLGGCFDLASDEVVSLATCASAVVGVVHTFVYGLPPVSPGDRAWVAASTGLDGTLRLVGGLRLVFGVEAIWPITRHRFLADGRAEPLFRQPFVTILGSLGLGVAF